MAHVELNLPYYRANADGNSETGIYVTFNVEIGAGGSLAGLTEDQVADAIRDYLAGLTGVVSHSLDKHGEDVNPL